MASVTDFRLSSFDYTRIERCGKHIGRQMYTKLYAIENLFRVVVHSVLSVQIDSNWWDKAVDSDTRKKVEKFQKNYAKRVWHGKPGRHGIYYIDLKDLSEILRVNANLFDPVVPELDKWLLGLEEIRLPRNIVAHMNFPSQTDIKRIDVFYEDCLSLVAELKARISLEIP